MKKINQYDINNNKTGYWEWYYNSGNLESKGNYVNGEENGYWEVYWYNGKIKSKEFYI